MTDPNHPGAEQNPAGQNPAPQNPAGTSPYAPPPGWQGTPQPEQSAQQQPVQQQPMQQQPVQPAQQQPMQPQAGQPVQQQPAQPQYAPAYPAPYPGQAGGYGGGAGVAPSSMNQLPPWMQPPRPTPKYRSYHLQGRNVRNYRWWKPLVAALLVIGAMTFLQLIVIVVGIIMEGGDIDVAMETLTGEEMDYTNPAAMLVSLGAIAVMVPAVWLAVRVVEGRSLGTVSSVAGRLRWGLLGKALLVAVAFMAVPHLVDLFTGAYEGVSPIAPSLLTIVVILIITPLQCAAEEYAFRGFLMQMVGGWTRLAWVAVLVTIPIFTAGHTQYGWKGLVDVGIFAIAMGWLVIRTGGLEAAIGLHVVNNTVGFMLGAFQLTDPMDDTEITIFGLVFSAAITLGYAAFIDIVGRRLGWFDAHPMFHRDPDDRPEVADPDPVPIPVPAQMPGYGQVPASYPQQLGQPGPSGHPTAQQQAPAQQPPQQWQDPNQGGQV